MPLILANKIRSILIAKNLNNFMKLILIRHGQTISNIKNICDDNPKIKTKLTKKGERQAKKAAEILKNKKFDIIFTSEFFRTNETADIINQYHNKKIKIDRKLDDRKTGFTGKPEKEFIKFLKNSGDFWNAKHKNGESFEEEKKRVISFVKNLKKSSYENVLIVTHQETIQLIKGYIECLENYATLKIKIDNCQIWEVDV